MKLVSRATVDAIQDALLAEVYAAVAEMGARLREQFADGMTDDEIRDVVRAERDRTIATAQRALDDALKLLGAAAIELDLWTRIH